MDMSKIIKCNAEECSYNKQQQCHALAITVGDDSQPRCDTFLSSSQKGGDMATSGQVGACKVAVCKYNQSLECNAGQIEVGNKAGTAFCLTFEL